MDIVEPDQNDICDHISMNLSKLNLIVTNKFIL